MGFEDSGFKGWATCLPYSSVVRRRSVTEFEEKISKLERLQFPKLRMEFYPYYTTSTPSMTTLMMVSAGITDGVEVAYIYPNNLYPVYTHSSGGPAVRKKILGIWVEG